MTKTEKLLYSRLLIVSVKYAGVAKMIDFAGLLLNAKNFELLARFIENGGLAEMLADVELAAAQEALSKACLARDSKSQIWNAIGHLETVYHSLLKAVYSFRKWHRLSWTETELHINRIGKIRYVLCIMAVCYWYVGEKELCKQHLDQADDTASLFGKTVSGEVGLAFAFIGIPLIPFDILRSISQGKPLGSNSDLVITGEQFDELKTILLEET